MLFLNFSFQLCGGATLALGIWVKYDKETFLALQIVQGAHSGLVFERIPYILIGIGSAMIILCFAGGCGACAESVCFLYFVSWPCVCCVCVCVLQLILYIVVCGYQICDAYGCAFLYMSVACHSFIYSVSQSISQSAFLSPY